MDLSQYQHLTVLVCGGRTFDDYQRLRALLDQLKPRAIIHGDARGADRLAGRYAREHGIHCTAVPAHWGQYGSMAGPMRNQRMLAMRPDVVVAFPGGVGTSDMVNRALYSAIPVIRG